MNNNLREVSQRMMRNAWTKAVRRGGSPYETPSFGEPFEGPKAKLSRQARRFQKAASDRAFRSVTRGGKTTVIDGMQQVYGKARTKAAAREIPSRMAGLRDILGYDKTSNRVPRSYALSTDVTPAKTARAVAAKGGRFSKRAKLAIGAGAAGLAVYGAYRLHKRNRGKAKESFRTTTDQAFLESLTSPQQIPNMMRAQHGASPVELCSPNQIIQLAMRASKMGKKRRLRRAAA